MHSPGRLIPEVEYYHGSRFKLENRSLSLDDVRELGNALSSNAVRSLSLQGVKLNDQGFRRICSSIGICRSLCSLNISDGVLTTPERVEHFCECLNLNRGLTALFLQGTPLRSDDVAMLSRAIKLHPTIRTLDLTNCGLTDASLRHVTSLLPPDKGRESLEDLSLGSNPEISALGWQHFSMAVADNSCLRSLQLYFNNIGDHAACLLVVAISASKSLVTLDLESTNITDQTGRTILQLLTDFPNHLRDINLTGNNISRELLQKIKAQMSIHSSFQGGPQPIPRPPNDEPLNGFNDSGPSAPYYIPSHGVTNRPQTVLEEEGSDFDFETPREDSQQANEARNALRDQLQKRSTMGGMTSIEDNTGILSARSEDSAAASTPRQEPPEKPLSPPLSARRIGTARPGARRPVVTNTGSMSIPAIEVSSGDTMQKEIDDKPGSSPGIRSEAGSIDALKVSRENTPFSDVIITDGAAMLDAQTNEQQPPDVQILLAPEISVATLGLNADTIPESNFDSPVKTLGEESKKEETFGSGFPNRASATPDEDPFQRAELSNVSRQSTKRTFVVEKKESSPISSPKPKTKTPTTSKNGSNLSETMSQTSGAQNKQKLKTETIFRPNLIPPDSSRLQVSKSLSFEKSLRNRTDLKIGKSLTDTSLTKKGQKSSSLKTNLEFEPQQKLEVANDEDVGSANTTLSNAYPILVFGAAQSREASQTSESSTKSAKKQESTNVHMGVPLQDPRIQSLRNQGREISNASGASEPTVASSYGGFSVDPKAKPANQNATSLSVAPNIDVANQGLKEVVRDNQVPVSNRMLDHGLNGEFSTSRNLSEESIPRSLKSLLSRHSSKETGTKFGMEPGELDEFTDNPKEYMYANRDK